MESTWAIASLWLGLTVIVAGLFAIRVIAIIYVVKVFSETHIRNKEVGGKERTTSPQGTLINR